MNALSPALPPELRRTFEVDRPVATHWRVVDCATAAPYGDCPHYADGFDLEFNPARPDLDDIRAGLRAGRYRWVEAPAIRTPGFVGFYFPAEQRCLRSRKPGFQHVVPRDRPPRLRVYRGDWRADLGTEVTHTRPEDFAEHLWETVDSLQTKYKEG